MAYRNTVVVQLMGGLGNQLFQFAAGLYVSNALGMKLCLDTRFFRKYEAHDGFCLNQVIDLSGIEVGGQWNMRAVRWVLPKVRENGRIDQLSSLVHNRRFWGGTGLYLSGYWQIAYTAEAVREELERRLSVHAEKEVLRIENEFFIHVRRGDYFTPTNRELFDVIPDNYYRDAVQIVLARFPSARFRVFSDDHEYALKFIQGLPEAMYHVERSLGTFEDFRLMSNCTGGICANSSFSWWAAFLGERKAMVIMPKRWDNISPESAHHRWFRNAEDLSNGLIAVREWDEPEQGRA